MDSSLRSLKGLVYEKSFGEIDVYRNTKWQPSEAYLLPQGAFNNIALQSDDIILFKNWTDLSAWSSVTGQWTLSTEFGKTILYGTNASSLSLSIEVPEPSTLEELLDSDNQMQLIILLY
jgi:hypothetical protein